MNIKKILEDHKNWILNKPNGIIADLSRTDLSGTNVFYKENPSLALIPKDESLYDDSLSEIDEVLKEISPFDVHETKLPKCYHCNKQLHTPNDCSQINRDAQIFICKRCKP